MQEEQNQKSEQKQEQIEEKKPIHSSKESGMRKMLISLIVLIIAGIGFYLISSKGAPTKVVVSDKGEVDGEYALKDIIALKLPFQCTFSKSSDSAEVDGAIFISGDNVRGDFDIQSAATGKFQSHFINKDNISYTWTSLINVGYKKALTQNAGPSSSPSEQASIVGTDNKLNYHCTSWVTDASQFALPTNITFKDLK